MSEAGNVFGIAIPEQVECMVQKYQWGRAVLILRLKRLNSPEVQYIRFTGVEYFAGPMKWTGAQIDQRTDEECMQLLRDAGRINDLVTLEHIQALTYALYTVTLPQTLVCAVSRQAHRYSG